MRRGEPRLHLFETVVREHAIDLAGKPGVKLEGITLTNMVMW